MNPIQILTVAVPLFVLTPAATASEVILGANRDNTLYGESGSESNGAGSHFFAGTTGMGQVRRAVLRFDVAAGIPAGSTITDVELTLYMSKTNAGVREVRLHRVLADWGEGTSNAGSGEGAGTAATTNDATWTRRFFPGISWTTPGGDFNPVASATKAIDQIGYYKWTGAGLVADVQAMLVSPAANFGWLLQNENEADTPTAKRFDSRQNTDPNFRPKLRIVYDPPCTASAANYCVGAPNSTGLGAVIGWSGSLSVAANSFTLTCAQLPPNSSHLFYFGTQQSQTPFGNGFRCVSGSVVRLNPPLPASPSGSTSRAVDLATAPAAGILVPGATIAFQCWYRNPGAGGAGFNLSDGLSVTFCN
ncbi:MAG: DNRLRE domain-containing protein [Planctomycetota bacterium]|nr:DNRLRE domain-containing protein [Planctomycetota bacterium]